MFVIFQLSFIIFHPLFLSFFFLKKKKKTFSNNMEISVWHSLSFFLLPCVTCERLVAKAHATHSYPFKIHSNLQNRQCRSQIGACLRPLRFKAESRLPDNPKSNIGNTFEKSDTLTLGILYNYRSKRTTSRSRLFCVQNQGGLCLLHVRSPGL